MRRIVVRPPLALSIATLVAALSGCDRPETPTSATPGSVAAGDLAQDEPFYYYRAQRGGPDYRIPLKLDPTEIAMKGPSREGVLAALTDQGLEVEADRYILGTGHRRYRLQGATAEAVQGAVEQLRDDPRVDFVGNAYRTSSGRGLILTDRVVARFEPGVGASQVQRLADSLGFEVQRPPPPGRRSPVWWLGYPRDRDPLGFAAELHHHPLVEWASPDFVAEGRVLTGVSDPYFDEQYYLRNDVPQMGTYVDIAAEYAWEVTTGDSDIRVAVIGTGIDGSHNQISHAKVTEAGCDDGYDALADSVLSGGPWQPWGYIPVFPDSADYEDSHETMVAGIIVGKHDQLGIAGIAPDVELLSVRIFVHDGVIIAPASEIAQAIEWAWDECDADVVSGSFHLEPHTAITTAINDGATHDMGDDGTVFVFSGANFSSRPDSTVPVAYPGNLAKTISVGAIDRWGEIAEYSPDGDGSVSCTPQPGCWGGSNWDPDLVALSGHERGGCNTPPDSLAPDVVTTDLSPSDKGCDDRATGYTRTFSGTSASAPQVAAAAALLLSDDGNLTREQVTDLLKDSADAWGDEAEFGAGKLNIGASLGNRAPPLLSSVTIVGDDEVLPNDECTWSASVQDGESPYSYDWYKNTIPQGTTQSVLVETGTQSFDLIVHVQDARGGVTVSDTLSVTVTGSAEECPAFASAGRGRSRRIER